MRAEVFVAAFFGLGEAELAAAEEAADILEAVTEILADALTEAIGDDFGAEETAAGEEAAEADEPLGADEATGDLVAEAALTAEAGAADADSEAAPETGRLLLERAATTSALILWWRDMAPLATDILKDSPSEWTEFAKD